MAAFFPGRFVTGNDRALTASSTTSVFEITNLQLANAC